jgi:hypothetical protein
MTITLDAIRTQQTKTAEMIAAYAAQQPRTISITGAALVLKPGEHYAGIVLDDAGTPAHHLVLLAEQATGINWEDAVAWAEKAGGELPTRSEQALLFANLKAQFDPNYYWSGTQYAANPSNAWSQYFDNGSQNLSLKSYEGRARAVRRVAI